MGLSDSNTSGNLEWTRNEWEDRRSQQRKGNYKKNLMEILELKNKMSDKALQITFLTKDLYPEYRELLNRNIRKQTAQ